MNPIIFSIFNKKLAIEISNQLGFVFGNFTIRQFPDQETYIRVDEPVQGREIILIDSLDRPNQKILPVLLLTETLKDLGAKSIGLVVPYLAYLRQDARFNPGEALTSQYFARLLSEYFDWLITVDPHLHRYKNLNEIYSINCDIIKSSPQISNWISRNVQKPLLIGPDVESEQWVSGIANTCDAPYIILRKIRKGDQLVEVSIPNIDEFKNFQPVLIDDIISTGRTMIETIKHLNLLNMNNAICIGIHAIFANDSYEQLKKYGIKKIVTCNTIEHVSNQIDLSLIMASHIKKMISGRTEK